MDIIKKALHSNINSQREHLADMLIKGKRANIGEIRTWGGQKYQKTVNGWVPVKENKNKVPMTGQHKKQLNDEVENLKEEKIKLKRMIDNVKESIEFEQNEVKKYEADIDKVSDKAKNQYRKVIKLYKESIAKKQAALQDLQKQLKERDERISQVQQKTNGNSSKMQNILSGIKNNGDHLIYTDAQKSVYSSMPGETKEQFAKRLEKHPDVVVKTKQNNSINNLKISRHQFNNLADNLKGLADFMNVDGKDAKIENITFNENGADVTVKKNNTKYKVKIDGNNVTLTFSDGNRTEKITKKYNDYSSLYDTMLDSDLWAEII